MKAVSLLIAILGLLILLASLLADMLGLGADPENFGARQVSGALLGVALLVVGIILNKRLGRREP